MRDRIAAAAAVAVLTLGGAACAAGPPPAAAPAVEAWSSAAVEEAAALLRLEDRREFDAAALASATASAEPRVRARAALAIGRIGTREAATLVRPLLLDGDSAVAASAAFSVGQLRDSASVGTLVSLLDSAALRRAPTVAAEAAAALGKIGTPVARGVLAALLRDADPAEVPPVVIHESLIASWRAGEEDPGPVSRWLDAEDAETRWRAAYALARRPIPGAVPLLLARLQDADPRVRASALRGLSASNVAASSVAADSVLPRLIVALADTAYAPSIEAIRVLGSYARPEVRDTLRSIVERGSAHHVVAAIEALGSMGSFAAPAGPALRDLALQPSALPHLRATAYAALAAVDPPLAATTSQALAADPAWRVRAALGRALWTGDAVDPNRLRLLARDEDPRVGVAALSGCSSAAAESVAPHRSLLVELLTAPDAHLRAGALGCLGRIADAALLPLLLDAYAAAQSDRENDAALAAIDALAALDSLSAVAPQRAFFARFDRPEDYLVRRRAQERFGAAATRAWGEVLPIATGQTIERYTDVVTTSIADPSAPNPRVEIVTSAGSLLIELFPRSAPLTIENFLLLAGIGFFDGQEWPRVVPNFVVQGGDPRGDTSGGPGYSIRDELNRIRFSTGAVGMAHAGPDTAGSQFFITHAPQPHLDGGYTVFGRLVEGEAVLRRLVPGHTILTVKRVATTDVEDETI